MTQMIGFRDRLSAYTQDANGTYTVVDAANVPCSLIDLNVFPATTAAQRAELGAIRVLIWDKAYVMPEDVQVEITASSWPEVVGTRWNPRRGTHHLERFPSGTPLYRHADVMRATQP